MKNWKPQAFRVQMIHNMRNHSSTECMLKEKILILSYKHVIFLLGKVQQLLHLVSLLWCVLTSFTLSSVSWMYCGFMVSLLCAVSQTLPNITALHHTTITHSRPRYYKTRHDTYVAATKTLSADGRWTLHNKNLQYATCNTLQCKYNFSAYSCYT